MQFTEQKKVKDKTKPRGKNKIEKS